MVTNTNLRIGSRLDAAVEDGVGSAGAGRWFVAEVAAVAVVVVDLLEGDLLAGPRAAEVVSPGGDVGHVEVALVRPHADDRAQRRFPAAAGKTSAEEFST